MNEAETRAELIDPKLKEAGWGVVEGSKILRERNCQITPGRIKADIIVINTCKYARNVDLSCSSLPDAEDCSSKWFLAT